MLYLLVMVDLWEVLPVLRDLIPLEQKDVPAPAADSAWEVFAGGGEIVVAVPFPNAFFRFRAVGVH
jgi:hypothetical protein